MGKEPFDYEEFGAQIAFQRNYPNHGEKETNESTVFTDKHNVKDCLQFLLEINLELKELENKKLSEEEVLSRLLKRKKEWGYIADPKFILKLMNKVDTL